MPNGDHETYTLISLSSFKEDQAANESLKAMQGLFDGSKKLYVYADGEKEIIDAITLSKQAGIDQIVLIGTPQMLLLCRRCLRAILNLTDELIYGRVLILLFLM